MKNLPLFLAAELPLEKHWITDNVSGILTHRPETLGTLFLEYSERGLSLVEVGSLSPLRVDFLEGELRHKRKQGVGKSSLLGKALGAGKGYKKILDATLGLGQDSWMFLCMGLEVRGVEKSKPVYMLTREALERAQTDPELREWLGDRLKIENDNVREILRGSDLEDIDVIYFDFMFPEKKKALPRKSMQLLAKLDLEEAGEQELLQAAVQKKVSRVVLKRPLKAPVLLAPVAHTYEGNSIRYDVYIPKRS